MKRSFLVLSLALFACSDSTAPAPTSPTSDSGSPVVDSGVDPADSGTSPDANVTPGGGTGVLDATFKNPDGDVYDIALFGGGKIVLGGSANNRPGSSWSKVGVFSSDGTADPSFALAPTEVNNTVATVEPMLDGKIVIGGNFNSTGLVRIGRLSTDGKRDATFNPSGAGAEGSVSALLREPSGKILVSGFLTAYNGTPRGRIARINEDGSLDTTFNPGAGAQPIVGPIVRALALQADGKVLVGGGFETFDGKARKNIARLNANGSVDESFNAGNPGVDGDINAIIVQPDGKVLVGGGFTKWNGAVTNGNYVVRLNTDGTIDASFKAPFALEDGVLRGVTCLALQSDGKVLAGGSFGPANIPDRTNVARFNADGTLDTSYTPPAQRLATLGVRAMVLQADGKLLVGGDGGVIRLN